MIELTGVRKAFDGETVLRGLDLRVETGETLAVIGRSGSGKSVLLRHVARLLRPDAGRVVVGGRDIGAAPESEVREMRLRMGYVFQFAALFDSMTVGENVALPLRRRGVARERIPERVARSLQVVGLEGHEGTWPAELSGGMRKRAGIARAVVAEPEYLLYDEPTTGLDPVTADLIEELMLGLKRELEATSVVVTHDLEGAFRVADRVAMLFEGRVRALGTPEEIRGSDDPVVRAFVEGRRELWPQEGNGTGGADGGSGASGDGG